MPVVLAKPCYPYSVSEHRPFRDARISGELPRGPLHECKANTQGLLAAIEAQLTGPFLFGEHACAADFSLYHVLWPLGIGGPFSRLSALITVAAAVALFRFKVGVIPLLAACAAAGLLITLAQPFIR